MLLSTMSSSRLATSMMSCNIMKVEVSSGEQSAVSAKSQLSTESKKAETKEAPPSQKSTSAIGETREETNTEKEKEEANNEEEKQEDQNQKEKEEGNIDKKKNETKHYKKKYDKKDYKKKNDKKDYTKKEAAKEKQKKEDANESKTDDNAEDDEKTRKRKKVAGEPKYPLFTVVYKVCMQRMLVVHTGSIFSGTTISDRMFFRLLLCHEQHCSSLLTNGTLVMWSLPMLTRTGTAFDTKMVTKKILTKTKWINWLSKCRLLFPKSIKN